MKHREYKLRVGATNILGALPEPNIEPVLHPMKVPPVKPARMSYSIPRLGGALKLLVDPQRDFGLFPSGRDSEKLGSELVTNGDFHDFTMGDVASANLKGHWIFSSTYYVNEATGDTIINDQSGNNNDLTALNFSTNFVDELLGSDNPSYSNGNTLTFNGIDEAFKIPSASTGDFDPGTSSWTIGFWLKKPPKSSREIIISHFATGGGLGWGIRAGNNNNFMFFEINGSIGGRQVANLTSHTFDNNWHFFCLVFKSSPDWDVDYYVDGAFLQTINFVDWGSVANTANDFFIGSLDAIWFLDGNLAEMAYWNKELSAQEVKEAYAAGTSWRTGSGSITPTNQSFAQRFTNSASSTDNLQQTVTVESGALYKVKFKAYRVSGTGTMTVALSGAATKTFTSTDSVYTTQESYILTTTTSLVIDIYANDAASVFEIDDITVKKIANASWSGTTVKDFAKGAVIPGTNGTMQNLMEDNQIIHPAAFNFDGVNDFVDYNDIGDPGLNDWIDFGWIKATDDTALHNVLDKTNHAIQLTTDDKLQTKINGTNYTKSLSNFKTGNWVFFVIVHDRSSNAYYFLNGVEDSLVDISAEVSTNLSNVADFRQGFDGLTYFDGDIGIMGRFIFDGQNGAPAKLPEDYRQLITHIYEQTKDWYK